MKEKVKGILEELRPDVDFEKEKELITEGILESFDMMALLAELSDAFDIVIEPKNLIADNFDSLNAIVEFVKRLSEGK